MKSSLHDAPLAGRAAAGDGHVAAALQDAAGAAGAAGGGAATVTQACAGDAAAATVEAGVAAGKKEPGMWRKSYGV